MARRKEGGSQTNLVEILDRIVALHGPVFAELLGQYREAAGISGYIETDMPRAILKDEDDRGYSHEEFEAKAAAALKPLVSDTRDIMTSFKYGGRYPAKFHVDIDRDDEGKVHFNAMISDGLGGVFVRRTSLVFEKHGYGFFCYPAEIAVMAFSAHKQEIDNVVFASRQGFDAALEFMIELGIVHNQKWHATSVVRKFSELFPTDGIARTNRMGNESLWLMAQSTHQPHKIMVSAEARVEMEGSQFVGADFETLPPRKEIPWFVH